MSRVSLTINGDAVVADVPPRMHLADFLREERLLTGTHLGCEHGICGACTIFIDGAPARSCIAFAVACDGADIRTIEGFESDPIIMRLRAAFTAEHALQCGYCTPGMLMTARDIVQRLPDADEPRIRLELAGNLCRCTGYAGIVRAIQRVLAEGIEISPAVATPLPVLQPVAAAQPTATPYRPGDSELQQILRIKLPLGTVWPAIRDPHFVAACMPGANLTEVSGDRLRGEVRASLGPIEALFSGIGTIAIDETQHRVEVIGEGQDRTSGTRLSARTIVAVRASDAATTEAVITIDYTLRGALAQIARGPIVRDLAGVITTMFAANMEARIQGMAAPRQNLSASTLMFRMIWQRLRRLLGYTDAR